MFNGPLYELLSDRTFTQERVKADGQRLISAEPGCRRRPASVLHRERHRPEPEERQRPPERLGWWCRKHRRRPEPEHSRWRAGHSRSEPERHKPEPERKLERPEHSSSEPEHRMTERRCSNRGS